jgi:hypothetical protein
VILNGKFRHVAPPVDHLDEYRVFYDAFPVLSMALPGPGGLWITRFDDFSAGVKSKPSDDPEIQS